MYTSYNELPDPNKDDGNKGGLGPGGIGIINFFFSKIINFNFFYSWNCIRNNYWGIFIGIFRIKIL